MSDQPNLRSRPGTTSRPMKPTEVISMIQRCAGSFSAGWSLYIRDKKPHFRYTAFEAADVSIPGTVQIPEGRVELKSEFVPDPASKTGGGTLRLFVDGNVGREQFFHFLGRQILGQSDHIAGFGDFGSLVGSSQQRRVFRIGDGLDIRGVCARPHGGATLLGLGKLTHALPLIGLAFVLEAGGADDCHLKGRTINDGLRHLVEKVRIDERTFFDRT